MTKVKLHKKINPKKINIIINKIAFTTSGWLFKTAKNNGVFPDKSFASGNA